jgi:hypothetical protein
MGSATQVGVGFTEMAGAACCVTVEVADILLSVAECLEL